MIKEEVMTTFSVATEPARRTLRGVLAVVGFARAGVVACSAAAVTSEVWG